MNREEVEKYIANKEQQHNLNPGEFRAVWGQESNFSTDPNLKGVYLPKHGTSAMGPFQVVPSLHPGFRPGSPLNEQVDYAIKFYASGGETPEQRWRRYYGTGTPPKGHPTTDQYVSQTMSRMPQQPASSPASQAQPAQQQPEIRMEPSVFQPSYISVPEPVNVDDFPQPPVMREPSGVQKWLADPLTQMGAAIMAASGSPLGAPIGYGVASAASGLGEAQKAENDLYELQIKREQAKRQLLAENRKERTEAMEWNQKQAALAQLNALADEYEKKGDVVTAAKIRAGVKSGLDTTSGLTPQFLVDENTNKVVQRIYKSDGTFIDTPLGDMKPAGISPGLQGQISSAKEQGKVQGGAAGTDIVNAPKVIEKSNQQLADLVRLRDHPGAKWATGLVSNIPLHLIKGTEAYDYDALQRKVLGAEFMAGFQELKGAGAITEEEGKRALAARTALERGLTGEERNRQIDILIEITQNGRARAEAKLRAGGSPAGTPAAGTPAAPRTPRQGWKVEQLP